MKTLKGISNKKLKELFGRVGHEVYLIEYLDQTGNAVYLGDGIDSLIEDTIGIELGSKTTREQAIRRIEKSWAMKIYKLS